MLHRRERRNGPQTDIAQIPGLPNRLRLDSAGAAPIFVAISVGRTKHWVKGQEAGGAGSEAGGRGGSGREAMTYRRGIAYHEAGHAVVGWALGLHVGISRVFHDDAKGWKGDTQIADASYLSLIGQIAVRAAGYTAERVFQCPAHERAADGDNAEIYLLLRAAGISEQDHPARIAEGNSIARTHLEAHKGKAIVLAERLAKCGHVDDVSEFLRSM
jgi:hypothetical protein